MKECLTISEYRILKDKNKLKSFQDADRFLKREQCSDFLKGETISGLFPASWKKFEVLIRVIEISSKVRKCEDCLKSVTKTCGSCEKIIYQYEKN